MKSKFAAFNILISFLCLNGCTLVLKKPEVAMKDFEIKKFTEKTIDLSVKIQVKNPNHMDLDVEQLKYGFQLNNSAFYRQELPSKLEIDGKSTKEIDLPISVPTDTLVGAVFDMLINKPLTYNFVGSVRVNGIDIAFNKTGTMPKREPL